jgi:hypothetical protein
MIFYKFKKEDSSNPFIFFIYTLFKVKDFKLFNINLGKSLAYKLLN